MVVVCDALVLTMRILLILVVKNGLRLLRLSIDYYQISLIVRVHLQVRLV